MNLLLRINLALGTAFVLAALLLAFVCSRLLETNARQELLREAGLMMDSAVATFAYTSEEILPLLQAPLQSTFLPQSVPFYATTQNFLKLHAQHPEYSFKEATLNPTNPRDRAMDWESDLIERFRNSATSQEIVGERDTPPAARSTSLGRSAPRRMPDLPWLGERRAGDPTRALRINNGFGWQPTESSERESFRCRSRPPEPMHGRLSRHRDRDHPGLHLLLFLVKSSLMGSPCARCAASADRRRLEPG